MADLFYVTIPKTVMIRPPQGGGPLAPYSFATFFVQLLLPRIPRSARQHIPALIEMFEECTEGQTKPLRAEQWQVMHDALPPTQGQQGELVIVAWLYAKVQSYYLAIEDAPNKQPEGWDDQPAAQLPAQPEAAE